MKFGSNLPSDGSGNRKVVNLGPAVHLDLGSAPGRCTLSRVYKTRGFIDYGELGGLTFISYVCNYYYYYYVLIYTHVYRAGEPSRCTKSITSTKSFKHKGLVLVHLLKTQVHQSFQGAPL